MASETNGAYEIVWEAKPLGFSIVMDTTGRNAYVSSIQKTSNLDKGLKLAAQIIAINGENVKGLKHQDILGKIKGARLPMVLKFQPRSFANEKAQQNEEEAEEEENEDNTPPPGLLFGGATMAANRVNGMFELVTNETLHGRNIWQRRDDEKDPIILYWYPAKDLGHNTNENIWMIARRSRINTDAGYACCKQDTEYPSQVTDKWWVYNQGTGHFEECFLEIAAKVNLNEESLNEEN